MGNETMNRNSEGRAHLSIVGLLIAVLFLAGCGTGKGTGMIAGAGVGALIGQAAGGDTGSTLVGAAIGTGVGYIIGDQVDEKKAKEMTAKGNPHPEVAPLGGTRWRLISLNTKRAIDPYVSKVIDFRPEGRVITTTTKTNGEVVVFDESYRVVGNTLIVNKPGYLVNARYRIDGHQLIVDDPEFSAVLERVGG
jgi:hypothetical protein